MNGFAASTAFDQQLGVVAPHVGGIATEREVGDLELDVVALLPLVPALGRALPGGVGVVGEDHLAGEVLDDLEVVVGEGGATGRHRVGLTRRARTPSRRCSPRR